MYTTIKDRVIVLLQLLLVVTYILFEELIWERIAKPIYVTIHALKILQKVEAKLERVTPSVILVIFVLLFAVVEAFGIYAGIVFVSGQVFLGVILYLAKIPVAAFTFWLFRITEDKLMQFRWFKWIYEWIMSAIDWLKGCEMYKKMTAYAVEVKMQIKVWKETYFSRESPFIEKMKHLYRKGKEILGK